MNKQPYKMEIWKNHFEQLYSEITMNPEQTKSYEKNIHMEHTICKISKLIRLPHYRKWTD